MSSRPARLTLPSIFSRQSKRKRFASYDLAQERLATMNTQTVVETVVIVYCHKCGTAVGLEWALYRNLQDEGPSGTFYCPNGHAACFRETEVDRLRREVEQKAKRITELSCEVSSERNLKMEARTQQRRFATMASNLKKRAKAGVCPCCKRTVSQMANHMRTQHPNYSCEAI